MARGHEKSDKYIPNILKSDLKGLLRPQKGFYWYHTPHPRVVGRWSTARRIYSEEKQILKTDRPNYIEPVSIYYIFHGTLVGGSTFTVVFFL